MRRRGARPAVRHGRVRPLPGHLRVPATGAIDALYVYLDRVEPETVVPGRGALVYVQGWCFHASRAVAELALSIGDREHPVDTFPYPRGDVASEFGRRRLFSGFSAMVPVPPDAPPGEHALELRATLAGGSRIAVRLGRVRVERELPAPIALTSPAGDDLVAVCMTTYEPKPALFRRQLESIRAQTHRNFVCLIADDGSRSPTLEAIERVAAEDDRFVALPVSRRLGFYRNFERCLAAVPRAARFVALSDHDDYWHPDKLETLVGAASETGVTLAYSDMNIVTEDGRLLAPSYWRGRSNNHTDLGSLILANTVTGAASVFRRELLDDVLPFPPNVGHPYHDHWIACVALASGRLTYVSRPLHDYVQHGGNVIGHYVGRASNGRLTQRLRRLATSPRGSLHVASAHAQAVYFADVVRLEMLARTLECRLEGRLTPAKAATVRRIASLSGSPSSLAWLVGRAARDPRSDVTLGAEAQLSRGIAWRHTQVARGRLARG